MEFQGRFFSEEEKELVFQTAHTLREHRELFSEMTSLSFRLEDNLSTYIVSFKDDIIGSVSMADHTLNNILQKLEYLYSFERNMIDDIDFSSRLSYLKTFTSFQTADIYEIMTLSFDDFSRLKII